MFGRKTIKCVECKHIISKDDAYKVTLLCQDNKTSYGVIIGKTFNIREEWYCPDHRQQYTKAIGVWDSTFKKLTGHITFLGKGTYLDYTYDTYLSSGTEYRPKN